MVQYTLCLVIGLALNLFVVLVLINSSKAGLNSMTLSPVRIPSGKTSSLESDIIKSRINWYPSSGVFKPYSNDVYIHNMVRTSSHMNIACDLISQVKQFLF